MEEFLFEESLLESMEIVSFEERDINEIVRENAHALLDAEMDMEELLCESGLELVEEGFIDTVKAKIKAIFDKIKELIRKFIAWVKSLFKKKEQAASAANNTKSGVSSSGSNNSGSSTSGGNDKKSDSKSGNGSSSSNHGSQSDANDRQNHKLLGAGSNQHSSRNNSSSNSDKNRLGSGSSNGNTEKEKREGWKDIIVELLDLRKVDAISDRLFDEMEKQSKNLDADTLTNDEAIANFRKILTEAVNNFEKEIETCWTKTTVDSIITVKNGKYQYESINKEFLETLEDCQRETEEIERTIESYLKNADEKTAQKYVSISQFLIGIMHKQLATMKSAYNKDMTNRQRAFIEVRKYKKQSA